MDLCTPPCSLETTPEPCKAQYAPGQTPVSSPPYSSPASHQRSTIYIPPNLTQAMVEADPHLKLVQRDLLVLTSMVDNSALSYRPTWFFTPQLCHEFWTLHNPPDVVSELLPKRTQLDRQVMTRRMRRFDDAAPMYLKTAADWARYCVLYGVPWDFLCEDQVRLLRLGLLRDRRGQLCGKLYLFPTVWPGLSVKAVNMKTNDEANFSTQRRRPGRFTQSRSRLIWASTFCTLIRLRVCRVSFSASSVLRRSGIRASALLWAWTALCIFRRRRVRSTPRRIGWGRGGVICLGLRSRS
jgi:hypothetical protein